MKQFLTSDEFQKARIEWLTDSNDVVTTKKTDSKLYHKTVITSAKRGKLIIEINGKGANVKTVAWIEK